MNCTAIAADVPAQLPSYSAHEFFHAWNVKRIRPQSLEPVDYTEEMWTRSLWFAEGVTSTYGSYTLLRIGHLVHAAILWRSGGPDPDLESRPGASLAERRAIEPRCVVRKISAVHAPRGKHLVLQQGPNRGRRCWTSLIRDRTDNRASLDDVLRTLNEEYAKAGRFYNESEGLRAVMEQVIRDKAPAADADLKDFFRRYISGTDEIPYADFLERAGLVLRDTSQRRATFGFSINREPATAGQHWFHRPRKWRERSRPERGRCPRRPERRNISARSGALAP